MMALLGISLERRVGACEDPQDALENPVHDMYHSLCIAYCWAS